MTTMTRLEKRRDGRLWALLAERAQPVKLRRCFPWTFPERYISLQTDESEELGVHFRSQGLGCGVASSAVTSAVRSRLRLLDHPSLLGRRRLRAALLQGRNAAGPARLSNRARRLAARNPDGGLLIEDVAGDVFRIEKPRKSG